MNIPEGLLCAKTHEYVLDCGDKSLVGITDIIIEKLGDIIFVEFPEQGSNYAKKEVFATIEADGAATELYMPIAAKILRINPAVDSDLSVLNSEPLSDGWLIEVEPINFQSDIYDLVEYQDYVDDARK